MRNRQLFVVNRCIPTKLFPNSSNEKNFLAILLCDSLPNRFPFDHFKKKIVKNFPKKLCRKKRRKLRISVKDPWTTQIYRSDCTTSSHNQLFCGDYSILTGQCSIVSLEPKSCGQRPKPKSNPNIFFQFLGSFENAN